MEPGLRSDGLRNAPEPERRELARTAFERRLYGVADALYATFGELSPSERERWRIARTRGALAPMRDALLAMILDGPSEGTLRAALDAPALPAHGDALEVVFVPSFHPECILTLVAERDGARLTMHGASASLAGYRVQLFEGAAPPTAWTETVAIPDPRPLWAALVVASTVPVPAVARRYAVADGMSVAAHGRIGAMAIDVGANVAFEGPATAVARALLANARFAGPTAQQSIAALARYLPR